MFHRLQCPSLIRYTPMIIASGYRHLANSVDVCTHAVGFLGSTSGQINTNGCVTSQLWAVTPGPNADQFRPSQH